MGKPLIVYEASAGSGKTFTLAAEYITLLVDNPQAYRQILAVTFTNKATEEMKTRILSQLFGIWRGLPESKSYTDFVCRKLDIAPDYAGRQAGIALHNLLHNYSYFRVETIDSFFQSVLRNLARELDLTATLRIGLNDVQVEEMAVDMLIESLTTTDAELQWLMHYIIENINDDRSWNVIGQIKQFGRTIFRDYYKRESKELQQVMSQEGFFEQYTATLRDIRHKAEKRMKDIAESFFTELEAAGLTVDDFSYGKSGFAGFFLKLREGQFDPSVVGKRVADSVEQPDKWCKKTHPRRLDIYALAEGDLGAILRHGVNEQPRQWRLFKSAELTLRHLNQLRLLESIEKKVREENEKSNLFLLSDTQQLLHELIDGSDSPFIFEKIGAQLEHIMIDEFQDTSTVQWQNFKVLLSETMSHAGTKNLIVGDVKQSIYRWRSGDWKLLAGIEGEFGSEMVSRIPLEYNYRSCRNIVSFNNIFFTEAAKIEEVSAYTSVCQQVPEGRPSAGYVDIRLLTGEDYQEQTLRQLCTQVEELLGQGIPASDMAILLRTNAYIPLIANYFMEHLPEVQLVSDEAFRLDASPAVMTIVQAMRLLAHPDNVIAKAYLAKTWAQKPLHTDTLDHMLPTGFDKQKTDLLRMPLFELAERLFTLFHLERLEGQSAYLCAFYDQIAAFADEQQGDLSAFLKEWDETLCAKTIQSPETSGLRLISIHKSKGLEFPTVIIPFCDWRMEHSDILWCKPKETPFNQLPIVPVDYSARQMEGTIYQDDYEEEHRQNTVDNLNLLYVAFTRAADNLFVIGKRGAKSSRSAVIEQVLPLIDLPGAQLSGLDDSEQPLRFTFGTLAHRPHTQKEADGQPNVFLTTPVPLEINLQTFRQKAEFRQSNKSQEFASVADEDDVQKNYIQMGSVLHHVFANIRTTDNVEEALRELENEGILYDETVTREKIETMIRQRFSDPRIADWFSPRWTLFNECTILSIDPQTGQVCERRPDRVMADGEVIIVVDFKFGHPRQTYHDQVRQYMQLLGSMGYDNIRGYLWYVYSNEIEEVR